jgi:hypothetical protein
MLKSIPSFRKSLALRTPNPESFNPESEIRNHPIMQSTNQVQALPAGTQIETAAPTSSPQPGEGKHNAKCKPKGAGTSVPAPGHYWRQHLPD